MSIETAKKSDGTREKLPGIQQLLQDRVAELRFRGCGADHQLVKQALAVNEWLNNLK